VYGVSLHEYVGSSPIQNVDPFGLMAWDGTRGQFPYPLPEGGVIYDVNVPLRKPWAAPIEFGLEDIIGRFPGKADRGAPHETGLVGVMYLWAKDARTGQHEVYVGPRRDGLCQKFALLRPIELRGRSRALWVQDLGANMPRREVTREIDWRKVKYRLDRILWDPGLPPEIMKGADGVHLAKLGWTLGGPYRCGDLACGEESNDELPTTAVVYSPCHRLDGNCLFHSK
jgi:hypothetical protein